MKVCLVSKYPPIEGGESSKAYWLARGLGRKGHEVHVVTNAWEVERRYRENIRGNDLNGNYQPQNVFVHNTDPFISPSHIPESKDYTEKVASRCIDAIRDFDLQIIDSWYMLPYVVSGFIAKSITGKPQLLRHAGSDITRLLNSPYLKTLFVSLFERVDRIITYPIMQETFESLGVPADKLFFNFNVSVDIQSFSPDVEPIDLSEYTDKQVDELPVITYIGKLNAVKGVYELVEAASKIKQDFMLLFVTHNEGLQDFQRFVESRGLKEKSLFLGFVPPWRIPSIIKRSLCVVAPERDFPVEQHMPTLPREVLATGGCLVLSRELYDKMRWLKISDQENMLVVDPKSIAGFRSTLEGILTDPEYTETLKQKARQLSEKVECFDRYVDDIAQLYRETLDGY